MLTKVWIVVFLCGATLYTTDAQITGWTVPVITGAASGTGASPISLQEDQVVGATATTFAATPSGTDTISSYTLLTSGTPFSVTTAGVLTLGSALDFETNATYTIQVQAVDSNASPNTGTATVSITVTDVNDAPTFSSASLSACVADDSAGGVTVTTVTATDQETEDVVTNNIASGDTKSEFTFSGSELLVSSGKTLARSSTATYTLVIHAVDDDSTPLTGTATLTVTVGGCSSATGLAVSIMMTFMALVVSLY